MSIFFPEIANGVTCVLGGSGGFGMCFRKLQRIFNGIRRCYRYDFGRFGGKHLHYRRFEGIFDSTSGNLRGFSAGSIGIKGASEGISGFLEAFEKASEVIQRVP